MHFKLESELFERDRLGLAGIHLSVHEACKEMEEMGKTQGLENVRCSLSFCAYSGVLPSELTLRYLDALEISHDIAKGSIIFKNEELAIFHLTELMIAIKASDLLWSFEPDGKTKISISTLRAARRSVEEYKGETISGELTHPASEKLARFLGLKIEGKTASLAAVNDPSQPDA